MKARLLVAMLVLCGAARANDVVFSVDVTPNEHVTGTVDVDDSSGEINSAKGDVSGAVSGQFNLDQINPQVAIGQGPRLTITFDRRNQSISARLFDCVVDNCTEGKPVTVWEKP